MKSIVAILFPVIVAILAVQCNNKPGITRSDAEHAERLTGLKFSPAELDTLLEYLEGNRKGYDSMRKWRLSDHASPALYFDPRPDHFVMKQPKGVSDFKLGKEIELPDTEEKIAFLTVAELSQLIRTKQISSVRLTEIYLNRLRHFGDTLQAIVTITEATARQQAARADAELAAGKYRGPLHGIPYGIKDLFAVPGYKTTWGAEPYQDQVINEKAYVVQKLEDAGAVLVAKLVSGALARGDVWFGGKTKNPWDLKQGATGSSAGSASATAAGLVAFSIGTETLGSILAPSSRCGATGLRPTFGSVSRDGAMVLSWSMDKAGPICRTAQDCALVFEAIRGADPAINLDRSVVNYPVVFNPPANLKGYRIGYFRKMFDKDTTRTKPFNEASLKLLRDLGAELVEVNMPDSIPWAAFDIVLRAESGAFFDELVREHRDRLLSEQTKESRANSLRQARFITAVEYLQANRHRSVLIEKFNRMLAPFDFVVAPSNGRNLSMATNLTGHPAMALPNGFDKQGRPTSLTLIGNLYDEGPMLEAAYLIQQASDFEEKHPARFVRTMK